MKVAVIGLDGATFDVIMPLMKEGRLPVLRKLVENGVHAKLKSTVPPLTPPGWVSAFTGMNPGEHGIFDWFAVETRDRLVNSTDVRSRAIWDLLNESGKKTIVINVPMTYPPKKIDGAMVSALVPPDEECEFTYPSELGGEIMDAGFKIEGKRAYLVHSFAMIRELLDISDGTCAAALHLINKLPWDFLMVVFAAPDRAQHHYWKYMDRTPPHDWQESRKHGKSIAEVYERIDALIGKLVGNLGEDTMVVIMSDHGFGPVHTDVYVNRFLMQLGLLRMNSSGPLRLPSLGILDKIRRFAQLIGALGIESVSHDSILFRLARRQFKLRDVRSTDLIRAIDRSIDFENTKAFFPSSTGQYIKINTRGRDPGGIVDPGQGYDELRNYLIKQLSDLRDPRNGAQVIEKVHRAEEVYHGPEVRRGPDLLLSPKEGYFFNEELGKGEVFAPASYAEHRPEGILIVAGPQMRHGISLDQANVMDVAPTVLYSIGVSIPRHMDGRLLAEIFDPSYLKLHPPICSDRTTRSEEQSTPYSPEEEAAIMRRLRDIGYI